MKVKTCAVLLVSFFIVASRLNAFDGQRKGFILGAGIGGGYLDDHDPYHPFGSGTLMTNFKIGYAPSNSLEVYYANNVSWFGFFEGLSAIGASCVAVTKYLKPEGKGFFVCGGVGMSSLWELGGSSSISGFGAFGGIGYDEGKHVYFQGDIVYTSRRFSEYSWAFRLTLNVLAF
jgi:hypothetical protein